MMKMKAKELVVALVQMRSTPDPQANLAKALAETRRAGKAGAKIVCLQELFRTPYFCQTEDFGQFDLAEPIPGPTTRAFSKVAQASKVSVIVPVFERRAPGIYHNSTAIIGPDGKLAGVYRKMHIPDDPAYYEKFYFTPGDLGFMSWELGTGKHDREKPTALISSRAQTSIRKHQAVTTPPRPFESTVRFGVLICWDQWFPEAARLTALAGAEILFYPTAIGWHPREKAEWGQTQQESWQTIQRAHAIANGVFVCAVNRVGREHPVRDFSGGTGAGLEFWGQSFVADPLGRVIAQASADREETLLVPVDLSLVAYARTHWPFLRDRRIEAYGGLEQRWGAEIPAP